MHKLSNQKHPKGYYIVQSWRDCPDLALDMLRHEVMLKEYQQLSLEILQGKTDAQLDEALVMIDSQLCEEFSALSGDLKARSLAAKLSVIPKDYQNFLAGMKIEEFSPISLRPSRVHAIALNAAVAKGESPETAFGISNLTWIECYALILLSFSAMAEEMCHRFITNEAFDISEYSDFYIDLGEIVGELLISATELYVLITATDIGKGINATAKLTVRKAAGRGAEDRARKAADARHAPVRELKERFYNWFLSARSNGAPEAKNYSVAAEYYFIHHMSDRDKSLISSPDTLRRYISSRLKAHHKLH